MPTTYMKIDNINGDVTAKGHENWIALESFSFATKRLITTDPGRIIDREGTRPTLTEVYITKKLDKSSALIFSESCVGKAKSTVKIDCCQTSDSLTPYLQLTLSNVIVSSYAIESNHTQHVTDKNGKTVEKNFLFEKVSLSFDKIEFRYTPFSNQNQAQSPISSGYDLKTATSA